MCFVDNFDIEMKRQNLTKDVFTGKCPPKKYGDTLEEIEATNQKVVEEIFRDADGILRCSVNGQTMKPYRIEDVMDRPEGRSTFVANSSIPMAIKPLWMNYENAGQASGVYLEALCAKFEVTGDKQAKKSAQRILKAILLWWKNASKIQHSLGGGGLGWFPKPYAGIRDLDGMHESSVDQYCDITLGLQRYYQVLATVDEKKQIEEIVVSFANWWYEHDFSGVYLGQAIWYKRLYTHSMAASYFLYLYALAQSWNPCRQFQHGFEIWQELRAALKPPGEAVWVCMNGITLNCLERLVELRPDLKEFWRSAARHQAPLVVASVIDRPGLNKTYEAECFAADYLTGADRILPNSGYGELAIKLLRECNSRDRYYHVRRGLPIDKLQEPEKGDDMRDALLCEAHVHWLAGYWKLREVGSLVSH